MGHLSDAGAAITRAGHEQQPVRRRADPVGGNLVPYPKASNRIAGHPRPADRAGPQGCDPVISKVSVPRGKRVEPLLWYLYGPGKKQGHTDPHIVAAWLEPDGLEPPRRPDGRRGRWPGPAWHAAHINSS